MSIWGPHPICILCWKEKNPDKEPVTIKEPDLERCCYCGLATAYGIYVRDDGRNLFCKGVHP